MIIYMTVKDNDFTQVLERFFDRFFSDFSYGSVKLSEMRTAKSEKDWEMFNEIVNGIYDYHSLLNENGTKTLNMEKRETLCEYIREQFDYYLDSCPEITDATKDYLKENLKVYVLYRLFDKDMNGECVYYFTSNNKYITM